MPILPLGIIRNSSKGHAHSSIARRFLRHFKNDTVPKKGISDNPLDISICRDLSFSAFYALFHDSRFPVLSKIA